MRVYAFPCGWLTSRLDNFLEKAEGEIRVPVPCFLIDHPKGKLLFDSGLHPDTQQDPHGRLGALARIFRVEFQPGEEVAGRLRGLGVDPARIDAIVCSHLHFDHAGGLGSIPNARLIVQRAEWEAGQDADISAKVGFDRRDYDHGHERQTVNGEHDVFGDGRVVCLPTYGHTPGHQSLRLRLDGGDVLLSGDACYLRRTLETMRLPRFVYDREAQLASLERLRRLEADGVRIVFGHDPEQWATIPQAPAAMA